MVLSKKKKFVSELEYKEKIVYKFLKTQTLFTKAKLVLIFNFVC